MHVSVLPDQFLTTKKLVKKYCCALHMCPSRYSTPPVTIKVSCKLQGPDFKGLTQHDILTGQQGTTRSRIHPLCYQLPGVNIMNVGIRQWILFHENPLGNKQYWAHEMGVACLPGVEKAWFIPHVPAQRGIKTINQTEIPLNFVANCLNGPTIISVQYLHGCCNSISIHLTQRKLEQDSALSDKPCWTVHIQFWKDGTYLLVRQRTQVLLGGCLVFLLSHDHTSSPKVSRFAGNL